MKLKSCLFIGLLALSITTGCATISVYDQYAYTQTVNLKVDSLAVMDNADKNYNDQEQKVNELMLNVQKAYEYEKGRAKNDITVKMWEILINPDSALLGGFMQRWKNEGSLKRVYIEEKKKQIGDAYDQIIGLEIGKVRSSTLSH